MRAIQTRRLRYIFNSLSDGRRVMATATTGTPAYRRMRELAATDPALAARHDLYQHRVVEELYDVEADPDCLRNLIGDPSRAADADRLRDDLEAWMERTADPMLEVFRRRGELAFREEYMRQAEAEAAGRDKSGDVRDGEGEPGPLRERLRRGRRNRPAAS